MNTDANICLGAPVSDPARPVGVQASAYPGRTPSFQLQRAVPEAGAPVLALKFE
jgi:hypothetical protein